jgi:hypothetical protein
MSFNEKIFILVHSFHDLSNIHRGPETRRHTKLALVVVESGTRIGVYCMGMASILGSGIANILEPWEANGVDWPSH